MIRTNDSYYHPFHLICMSHSVLKDFYLYETLKRKKSCEKKLLFRPPCTKKVVFSTTASSPRCLTPYSHTPTPFKTQNTCQKCSDKKRARSCSHNSHQVLKKCKSQSWLRKCQVHVQSQSWLRSTVGEWSKSAKKTQKPSQSSQRTLSHDFESTLILLFNICFTLGKSPQKRIHSWEAQLYIRGFSAASNC